MQNYIIYLKMCLPSKLTAGCMLYLYTHCLSFICWLCLNFRNEFYKNNIWRWDINEIGFKMTCMCCFHIVCTRLKQKSVLAHHYEWKISQLLFHAKCIAHEYYNFVVNFYVIYRGMKQKVSYGIVSKEGTSLNEVYILW